MKLHVEWSKPIPMRKVPSLMYNVDLDLLPAAAGVYVFGRKWGTTGFEALYVGKALNIRHRIRGQLNNLRLMTHIRDAKMGKRVVLAGSLAVKGGQQVDECITLAERAFIRFFLSEGHDLVNISGTKLRQHEVNSTHVPMRFVPDMVFLERAGRR